MRRVNYRFAAFSLATLLLCVGVVYGVHRVQVRRNAGALLAQANREEEQGRPDGAARYLARYLAFTPHDGEALTRYGLLLAELAPTPGARINAFLVLDRALENQPDRDDAR